MVVLFGLEITTAFTTTYINNSLSIVLAYRIIMALYCLIIVILSAVFGVRFFFLSRKDVDVSSASSARAAASKRNLSRLVLLTTLTFFIGIVILAIMAIVPINSVAAFYVPEFLAMICLVFLGAAILFVFFSMMKSRMGSIDRGTDRSIIKGDEKSAQLETPLIDPEDREEESDGL